MNNAYALFLRLILAVCLSLFGPATSVMAGDGAVLSVELCADGVVKTVLLGEDGTPIAPSHDCADCPDCSQAGKTAVMPFATPVRSNVLLDTEYSPTSFDTPVPAQRYTLPVPRGPPAVDLSFSGEPGLTDPDQAQIQTTRGAGQLTPKDASA